MLNTSSFELSLEQQFTLRQIKDEIPNLSRQELEDKLLQAVSLAEIRQNIIKDLMIKLS